MNEFNRFQIKNIIENNNPFNTSKKIIIIFILIILFLYNWSENPEFDTNFDYINYENNIITEKMKQNSNWELSSVQAAFINGLIRKYKPKNCLEIGVAKGGSSILILNAIKDFPDSILISIDLNENYYKNKTKRTGYLVKEEFNELTDKWKLFLGDMPHKFLSKLNMKFDFLFLDSAHVSPGEFFNLIEALPFLNENAIVVLHDVIWHFFFARISNYIINNNKIMPTQIVLMSSLIGKKIFLKKSIHNYDNIGAIYLEKNQKKYYVNYFLLLMNIWQYIPSEEHLKSLRDFIDKFYENKQLLDIYDYSVKQNINLFK